MKIKSLLAASCLLALPFGIKAQRIQTPLVEHFTNTSCGICANNNMGYFNTLNQYPNAIHISFHPSAPYANDIFNLENRSENDGRTQYYNIYGGTPRLVVNGTVIQNNQLNQVLNTASQRTSNFELHTAVWPVSGSTFKARVVVKKIAADTLSSANLFMGVAEDTINQTTNNGETAHYNVFRKALTNVLGDAIPLPSAVNDSLVVELNFNALPSWNTQNLFAFGILQGANKLVVNSGKSATVGHSVSVQPETVISDVSALVFPNPSLNKKAVALWPLSDFQVLSSTGLVVYEQKNVNQNDVILLSHLKTGLYFVSAKYKGISRHQKIIVP